MTVTVHLMNAAPNNDSNAVSREQWRLLCLAWCMRHLGEKVFLSHRPEFRSRLRKAFAADFAIGVAGIDVMPERVSVKPGSVVVKTSMGTANDDYLAGASRVLVAHNYDPAIDGHASLLPVPLMVHDKVMEHLLSEGLMEAYLTNDLDTIREHFGAYSKGRNVGFCGTSANGRAELVEPIKDLCSLRMAETPSVPVDEYLRWSAECVAVLNLPGVRPKCYRFAEMAMLGVLNCGVQMPLRITPPLTKENSILMDDWSDRQAIADGLENVNGIREAADISYKSGWSPMGQSRLILERLGVPVPAE